MSIAETKGGSNPWAPAAFRQWVAAHLVGAVLLSWISIANGFPLVFADSGAYLRVGTELHYLLDRSVVYGLVLAATVGVSGLWAIVAVQALLASWLIGQVIVAITGRRSAMSLVIILAALAGFSSLPWFVGQIMPDLGTSLMALTLYLMLFVPGSGVRALLLGGLTVGMTMLHLSNIPIAATLIGVGGVLLCWQAGWRTAASRMAPATLALIVAIFGLCSANLVAAGSFRPSLQSEKFLVAKTLDSHIGQPVLERLCRTEDWMLCKVKAYVSDPRRRVPGQDYLWASDTPRTMIEESDPTTFRAEENAFARRVFQEDPVAALRIAGLSWRDQLIAARSADGMIAYSSNMEVVKQIHDHFPNESAAFDASTQQNGKLQKLAVVPDRAIALLVVLLLPLILTIAIRRGDQRMVSLTGLMSSAVVINAAVCGILSGPADRYQSRVIWLLLLVALVAVAQQIGRPRLRHHAA